MRSLAIASVCLVAGALTQTTLGQGRLIGVNGSNIFEIDMGTAAITQLGSFAGAGTIGGLAYDWNNNVLYMVSSQNQNLYKVNMNDWSYSTIGTYGLATNPIMQGLEYDSSTNTLYGMSAGSSHGFHLYALNTSTGAATNVGTSPLTSFHNLGFNSNTGVMYMTNSSTDSLYTIDLNTATPTLVGALGGPTNPNGLAFNHDTNTMFMIDNTQDQLYTLNLATGAATSVGSVGSANFLSLAYVPVPEPGTMIALGAGGLALLARRRRKA